MPAHSHNDNTPIINLSQYIHWINEVYHYIYRHIHTCTLTSQSSSGNWDRTGMRLWARSGLSLEVGRERRRRRRSREEKEDITHCTATTTLLHQLQLILSYTQRSIPFTHRAIQREKETATHHKARPALLYSYYSSCPWRAALECP